MRLLALPLLLLAVLLAGCSSDEPSGEAGEEASGYEAVLAGLPTDVREACASYAAMTRGVEAVGRDQKLDAMAAEMAGVMKEWARQVPDLERPPGMDAAAWRGIQALAQRITALPDEPTMAQLEAVEQDLTGQERAAVEDASRWFLKRCRLR